MRSGASSKCTRRRFLGYLPLAGIGLAAADAFALEPRWLRLTDLDFSEYGAGRTFIHFSDLHYKGNEAYADRIVETINGLTPDFVVFTGDLVESRSFEFLDAALALVASIDAPVYGVWGNHDPRHNGALGLYRRSFEATGGRFLVNERVDLGPLAIHGVDGINVFLNEEGKPKILLCHYPAVGHIRMDSEYLLALCGHSHGGQVRVPFYGALVTPYVVGPQLLAQML